MTTWVRIGLIGLLITGFAFGQSKSPIREFLSDSKKGLGFENPSLVELLTLSYGTLKTIYDRIEETKRDLRNSNMGPVERAAWQKRLSRAHVQYRLAWELLGQLVQKSLTDFDLRGAKEKLGAQVFQESLSEKEREERDKIIKNYIIDQARGLFLGTLKFQALKQEPVVVPESLIVEVAKRRKAALEMQRKGMWLQSELPDLDGKEVDDRSFDWLDKKEFELSNPDAGINFANAEIGPREEGKIQIYRNLNIPKLAVSIIEGFKRLVDQKKFIDIDLNTPPSFEKRKELIQLVIKEDLKEFGDPEGKKIGPMVMFFTHTLGILIDPFNVNTHDSYDLMRGILLVLSRHVLDIDGHENWGFSQIENFEALTAGTMLTQTGFFPFRKIIQNVKSRLKSMYDADVANGPKLVNDGETKRQKDFEYQTYHGDIYKDLFGRDVSHWVWPGNPIVNANEPRIQPTVKVVNGEGKTWAEGRNLNGTPREEIKHLQDGDLWLEKGTGMGSDLIPWSTSSAKPSSRLKSAIVGSSVWGVAKGKLYDMWAGNLGWLGKKAGTAVPQFQDFTEWLVSDYPGKSIDYSGASHTGIVSYFEDPNYPLLSRADLVDSFPNLMRQTWRRHGCGHSHSRLCIFLRIRKEWALHYANHFNDYKSRLEKQLREEWTKVSYPNWLNRVKPEAGEKAVNEWILTPQAFTDCKYYLVSVLNFKTTDEMMKFRKSQRPGYQYCMKVLQYQGMRNFYDRIVIKNLHLPQGIETESQIGTRLVHEMGKLVTEKVSAIRNQTGEEVGFGTKFDDRFDSFSKGALYCSEHADLAYRLAWGQEVYPKSKFKMMLKMGDKYLPEKMVGSLTGGFIKVPWEDEDTVYAPKSVMEDPDGRKIWEVIGEMRRAFFGVTNE